MVLPLIYISFSRELQLTNLQWFRPVCKEKKKYRKEGIFEGNPIRKFRYEMCNVSRGHEEEASYGSFAAVETVRVWSRLSSLSFCFVARSLGSHRQRWRW